MRPIECSVQQGGWTYVWVLMIISLLGLGLTIAVEVDATAVRRDKEKELLAIGRQYREAIRRYYEAPLPGGAVRQYPATLDDLLRDDRGGTTQRHLRKIFIDPITGKAEWGLVFVGGRIVGVHSLSQAMPIKQDGFDVIDEGFRGKQRYSEWVFSYPVSSNN